ncbi:glycosyltransferase family 4 protein [Pseudoalteromonas piscicida]|uniref:Glycosyl transferase n=1 Tax=Pseudoalteromonas piscicida TaxID=43662 RepID=A0A2A5JWG0_PSEO7|nr:glycosyltransferase family 4 protein [Pseudoalteromonas piscicida]PCK33631.1 glycosyl transferase [Pseudoalteromonas piscicida]
MNVGIVTTWFERGAAYVSRQIKESLENYGYQTFIYVRGSEYDKNWDAKNVYWAKRQRSPMPTDIVRSEFQKWIKSNNIDVIIFNEQHYWQPVIWAKKLGVKVIAYVDYYKENTIDAFGLYDQIWCNTQRHYSVFSHLPQSRFVQWGTNTQLFSPPDKLMENKTLTFFHSAGMSPERKGTEWLLQAVIELAQKRQDFKVIIHSQVDLYSRYSDLLSALERELASGLLTIESKTVPAPGLYHLGDVYVYPSLLEGIGLTIAEALSVGLPTIVTDEAPMNEFSSPYCRQVAVEKRYARADGYYWPIAKVSIRSLTDAMESYLIADYDMSFVKDSVRNFALEHFDWEKNALALGCLIEECKNISIDDKALECANLRDYYAVPYFNKLKNVYYLAYDLHRFLAR